MNAYHTLDLRKFVAPEIVFGAGAVKLAARYAKNFGAHRVLIVTDPGICKHGHVKSVADSLEDIGLQYAVFSGVAPNPDDTQVMEGSGAYEDNDCDIIIAIGGGSPMDCAKGIGIVSTNKKHILSFEGVDRVPKPGPPLICIPTTAGSSADVSQFAIIKNSVKKNKIAIISKTVVPDVALIDPATTRTMPDRLTACTGMDALTHAIEAYVSNASSPLTDIHAIEAIRLVSRSLIPALNDRENLSLRANMMLGSLNAGLAFSNASLGAVHALAHSLGGYYDLPHGECNAVLLRHVVDYNFDSSPDRYAAIADAMGIPVIGMGKDTVRQALREKLASLQAEAGIMDGLGKMGVKTESIPELARMAYNDPCIVTNPEDASVEDIIKMYESAF